MEKPIIRIFHNLARSGGTLVCRCLGCMDNIVLFSEIHPYGTHMINPIAQAHGWYNLIYKEDFLGKESIDFVEVFQLIEKRCTENSKCLVIRDWSHLDFIGLPFLSQPTNHMVLAEALSDAFEIYRIALVRHPIDQWLSSVRRPAFQHIGLHTFLEGYLKYTEQIIPFGFVRYEDFIQDPESQMNVICNNLKIKFDNNFIFKWHQYNKITGDSRGLSRAYKLNKIVSLPRQEIENKLLLQFRSIKSYWKAIELLGYKDA